MQHFLGGDTEEGGPPALDRHQLVLAHALVDAVLEAECGEEVLAHQAVLQLSRLADHVDERLAMLDDQARLGGGRLDAACLYDLGQHGHSSCTAS
jgi:hypothetical protein